MSISNTVIIATAVVLGGGFSVLTGIMMKELIRDAWVNIKSRRTDIDVNTHFSPECVNRFYKEQCTVFMNSSLSRSDATIVVATKWKADGRWEECYRN